MSKNIQSRYSASFTAGSLLHKEITALLPLLQAENAEEVVRDEIKKNELLHINSESARKRIVYEIFKRTQSVEQEFWPFYGNSNQGEQKLLLFYLCLKTYPLMFDFHFNITVKQWNTSSQLIEPYYYQMELEEIAIRDETVDKWTDTTKRKAISVYLRILKEIRLIDDNNKLRSINMSELFWRFFVSNKKYWFLDACLLSNSEKERMMTL